MGRKTEIILEGWQRPTWGGNNYPMARFDELEDENKHLKAEVIRLQEEIERHRDMLSQETVLSNKIGRERDEARKRIKELEEGIEKFVQDNTYIMKSPSDGREWFNELLHLKEGF